MGRPRSINQNETLPPGSLSSCVSISIVPLISAAAIRNENVEEDNVRTRFSSEISCSTVRWKIDFSDQRARRNVLKVVSEFEGKLKLLQIIIPLLIEFREEYKKKRTNDSKNIYIGKNGFLSESVRAINSYIVSSNEMIFILAPFASIAAGF